MSSYDSYATPATADVPLSAATGVSADAGSTTTYANGGERVTRILVVGETRVGKTLLIRRLCDHIFGDTSIETHTVDCSPFSNYGSAAEKVADEDDLGPEWGPTVGLSVCALKRTTTVACKTPKNTNDLSMPSLYPPTQGTMNSTTSPTFTPQMALENNNNMNSNGCSGYPSPYGGIASVANCGLQYRGSTPNVINQRNNFNSAIGGNSLQQHPFRPSPHQHRCAVTQTVEFHELGGTHGYRDIARLPLRNIQYDGVIFVYHRRNLTSTIYLSEWYHWVRSVLSTGACVSGPGNQHNNSNRWKTMPRFMLVGTQLEGDELTAAAAGVRKEVDSTLHIGTVAVSDEALLDGNFAMKVRALESPQTPTHCSRIKRTCRAIGRSFAWPYHVLWCLWHPFFFLSVQYQEERGPRSKLTTLYTRPVEQFVWLLYKLEQMLLYLMAVVLFGPYQEAVVLSHSRTKKTLEELRKDEQCVAQAHVCRLDTDIALQSSLDEIVAFFDILLRED